MEWRGSIQVGATSSFVVSFRSDLTVSTCLPANDVFRISHMHTVIDWTLVVDRGVSLRVPLMAHNIFMRKSAGSSEQVEEDSEKFIALFL